MTDRTSPETAHFEALMEIRRIANKPGDRRALVDRIYGIATEAARKSDLTATPDLWQPIETAPKDKAIMLCVAGWQPCSGRWWPVDSCWTSFDWEGHFETDAEMTSYCNGTSFEPTHWMPLPQGPNTSTVRQMNEDEVWVEVTDGTTLPGDRFSYIPNPETGVGQITSHKRRVQSPDTSPVRTGCICQDQHRRGYCTEPGCSFAIALARPIPEASK